MQSKQLLRSRALRKSQTDAEKILWQKIRARRLLGIKFRRQVPIGNYIVDFLCMEKKLIIELDGGQHATRCHYDNSRTIYLQRQGYQVVRYWNNDVMSNLCGVLYDLQERLK